MKKLLSICFIITLLLVGCGGSKSLENSEQKFKANDYKVEIQEQEGSILATTIELTYHEDTIKIFKYLLSKEGFIVILYYDSEGKHSSPQPVCIIKGEEYVDADDNTLRKAYLKELDRLDISEKELLEYFESLKEKQKTD